MVRAMACSEMALDEQITDGPQTSVPDSLSQIGETPGVYTSKRKYQSSKEVIDPPSEKGNLIDQGMIDTEGSIYEVVDPDAPFMTRIGNLGHIPSQAVTLLFHFHIFFQIQKKSQIQWLLCQQRDEIHFG